MTDSGRPSAAETKNEATKARKINPETGHDITGIPFNPEVGTINDLWAFAASHCQDCIGVHLDFNPIEGWEWSLHCCCLEDSFVAGSFGALVAKSLPHDTGVGL